MERKKFVLTIMIIASVSLLLSFNSNSFSVWAQSYQPNNETFQFVKEWIPKSLNESEPITPTDLEVDSTGSVYILDGINNQIQKFDSNGTFITKLETYGEPGETYAEAAYYDEDDPTSIAIDNFDDVYILDSDNSRVQKFDSDGNFLTVWGSAGTGDKQFNSPTDIAIDFRNNIYISDAGNNRIQKFDSDGNLIEKFGVKGREDGQFLYPMGLAVDSSGNVYTLESQESAGFASGNNRIQKFDSNGTFITKWGSLGKDDGQFEAAVGFDIDSEDNVYVGDYYIDYSEYNDTSYTYKQYDKIQKFDSNGTFLTKLNLENSSTSLYPIDFSIDAARNMYIFNGVNDQIQIFSANPNNASAIYNTKNAEESTSSMLDDNQSELLDNFELPEHNETLKPSLPLGITDLI